MQNATKVFVYLVQNMMSSMAKLFDFLRLLLYNKRNWKLLSLAQYCLVQKFIHTFVTNKFMMGFINKLAKAYVHPFPKKYKHLEI